MMKQHRAIDYVALVAWVGMLLLLALAYISSVPAGADPLDLEARVYKPLAPDVTLEVGGGIAVELGTVPERWFVVGPVLGGHKVFADILYIRGKSAFGGSVSLRKAERDDHIRLWGTGWKDTGWEWSCGVAVGWPLDVGGLF